MKSRYVTPFLVIQLLKKEVLNKFMMADGKYKQLRNAKHVAPKPRSLWLSFHIEKRQV